MIISKEQESKYLKLFWILFYSFAIGSLFLLNNGNVSIQSIGFCLIILVGAFLSVENTLVFVAALEPLSIIFKYNEGYTAIPFLFLILFAKLICKKQAISKKQITPLFFIMTVSMLNYFYRGFSLSSYVAFFTCLLCFVWLSQNDEIDFEAVFEKTIWLYVISTLIECVLSGVFTNAVSLVTSVSTYNLRDIGFSNEWDYGRHIVVSIAFLFYWIRVKKKFNLVAIGISLYLVYCLVSTGLYSGLVALGTLILTIPFSFNGPIRRKILYMALSILICIVLFIVAYYWVYLPMFELRGQISDNGRFELWNMYYHDFIQNPEIALFGIGAGAIPDYASSISRLTTHNILIEKLFELGFVGFTMLIFLLKESFSNHGLRLSKNYRVLPLIVFLGTCLTQGVSGGELIFILMIMCL